MLTPSLGSSALGAFVHHICSSIQNAPTVQGRTSDQLIKLCVSWAYTTAKWISRFLQVDSGAFILSVSLSFHSLVIGANVTKALTHGVLALHCCNPRKHELTPSLASHDFGYHAFVNVPIARSSPM